MADARPHDDTHQEVSIKLTNGFKEQHTFDTPAMASAFTEQMLERDEVIEIDVFTVRVSHAFNFKGKAYGSAG
jgi:hypothetical protein